MKQKIYQVDAFTNKVFSGNPAAVCPLEQWLDDSTLQNIAAENNLAETSFFVKTPEGYHLRWFTPKTEVDLCGHATLAAAYVLFRFMHYAEEVISFRSRSRKLTVSRDGSWLTLNFPADKVGEVAISNEYAACFDKKPALIIKGLSDLMFVYDTYADIRDIQPDLRHIAKLPFRGIIVTSIGMDTDFASRFFAPACGIDEDPATGSAHTTLAPYWSKRLGKNELTARQISERGGFLKCKLVNDRVEISGQAAFYMEGEIEI